MADGRGGTPCQASCGRRGLYASSQPAGIVRTSSNSSNRQASKTSSRNVRWNRSLSACWAGWPGWRCSSSSCFSFAQRSSRCELNAGPLSIRICFGAARQSKRLSNPRTRRSAGKQVSTSIHQASRAVILHASQCSTYEWLEHWTDCHS